MTCRLLLRRDTEPFVIRIEGHAADSSRLAGEIEWGVGSAVTIEVWLLSVASGVSALRLRPMN